MPLHKVSIFMRDQTIGYDNISVIYALPPLSVPAITAQKIIRYTLTNPPKCKSCRNIGS